MEIGAEVRGCGGEGSVNGGDRCYVQGHLEDIGVSVWEVGERGWVAGCGYEALVGLAGDQGGDAATYARGAACN